MDEIENLLNQLEEIQESKPRKTLSERNAMDILDYLKKRLGAPVVSTMDGLSFLTLDRLDQTVFETLQAHKKVKVDELENMLNVSSEIIEQRLDTLQRKFGLTILNAQLITREYIEFILREIKHELAKKQFCVLSDFALSHDLEVSLLRSFIQAKNSPTASFLAAQKCINNVLYSDAFSRTLAHQLEGVLNAVTVPLSLDVLAELLSVDRHILGDLLATKELKREGDLVLPKNFAVHRKRLLNEQIARQGFIEYATLQKNFSINKPREYLRDMLGADAGTFFDRIFVSAEELQKLSTLYVQKLKKEGIVDVTAEETIPFHAADRNAFVETLAEELKTRGLSVEQEREFLWLKPAVKAMVDSCAGLEAIREKDVIDKLVNDKRLPYMADDKLKKFVFARVKADVEKARAAATQKAPKKSKFVKGDEVDFNKYPVDKLITRMELLIDFYLLVEKSLRGLGKEFQAQADDMLGPQLSKLKRVVIENIVFVLIRKHKLVVPRESFENVQNFDQFPAIFEHIFAKEETAVSATKQLPKEFRDQVNKIFFPEGVLDLDSVDLVKVVSERGIELTISNFDTVKNKKREKAFV